MNLNNLTIKAQEAIQRAQEIAQEKENQAIEVAHLLKGIFEIDENVTPFILKKLSINVTVLEKAIEKIIDSLPKISGGN